MELDNIKQIWKEIHQQTQEDTYNEEAIFALMKGKSRSVIASIRKNLRFEMILTAVIMLFFIILPFIYKGELLQIILGLWALICGIYLFFYLQKYKIIESFNENEGNLKENLHKLIHKLRKYTKIYFWSNVVLIPLVHITNFIFLRFFEIQVFHNLAGTKDIIIYLIYVTAISIAMIYFFHWYIQRLYGKYIGQLQKYVDELNEI